MERLKYIVFYMVAFVVGFLCCWMFWPRVVTVPETREQKVIGNVQADSKTDVSYVPKKTTSVNGVVSRENTDLDISIPKQEINVKINGKEAVIKKSDDEEYVFDKNKVQVEHKSSAEISIAVPVIDKTRYWGLGIGYGRNGVAGVLDFPINKKSGVEGWLYADRVTGAGGVKVRF